MAPRLRLFTRAAALHRLWYFCFQMPGMERHVSGEHKITTLAYLPCRTFFSFDFILQSRKTYCHADTVFVRLLIKKKNETAFLKLLSSTFTETQTRQGSKEGNSSKVAPKSRFPLKLQQLALNRNQVKIPKPAAIKTSARNTAG